MKKLNSYRKVQAVSKYAGGWICGVNPQIRSSETPPSFCPHSATPGRYRCWDSDPFSAFSSPFARLVLLCLAVGPRLWSRPALPGTLHPESTLALLSAAGGAGGGFPSVAAGTPGSDFGGCQPHLAGPGCGWIQYLRRCSQLPEIAQTWVRV